MKKEKRKLILESAKSQFEEKGYHGAKISEIAKHAGIGKGTVYEYFDSKQSIFEELIVMYIDMYFEYTNKLLSKEVDPIKKLKILIEIEWEVSRDHGAFINLVISRITSTCDDLKAKFFYARANNLKIISQIIDDGISKGVFKQVDSKSVAMMFKGTFSQANLERSMNKAINPDYEQESAFDQTTINLFDLFLGVIKNK